MPTPPGSNKPSGQPEDTALGMMTGRPTRIGPAHPSPGLSHHLMAGGGVNILAPAELSKMFPTPPSHEHPMQSPQMEGLVESGPDQNGIKTELNGSSPTYEDPNKVATITFNSNSKFKVNSTSVI